jgi:hypothetical protein
MAKVEFDIETSVSASEARSALLDFTDRRPQIWPSIEPSLYEVGDTYADIKEGNNVPGGVVWAKEHYDWADPVVVTWTVRESYFCAPAVTSPRPSPRG